MKSRPSRKTLALTALLLAAGAVRAGEVEVLHWWTSGGEARPVAELKKILESKGDKRKDFAVAGGGGETAMTVLKSRVVSGKPPTAVQVKGPDRLRDPRPDWAYAPSRSPTRISRAPTATCIASA